MRTLREVSQRNKTDDIDSSYASELLTARLALVSESAKTKSIASFPACDLETIQSIIPADTALIEYYYCKEVSAIFVVTSDKLDHHLNIDIDLVKAQTIQLLGDPGSRSGKTVEAHINRYDRPELSLANLQQLYEHLVSPIEGYIEDKKRLVIVPHGFLHYIPFSALYDGQEYLIQNKIISISSSASVLSTPRSQKPNRTESCVAFINPMIDPEFDNRDIAFIDSLANYFGECHIFAREDATKSNVNAKTWGRDIIHFDCHVSYNRFNGLCSYLLLSNGNPENPMIDPMYTTEVSALDLSRASLVVLSVCNASRGSAHSGDEIVSLTRGFLGAGASSVLASLWDVQDKYTKLLMDYFYRALTNKQHPLDKASALQYAQRMILERYDHPNFFAGFSLYGSWD